MTNKEKRNTALLPSHTQTHARARARFSVINKKCTHDCLPAFDSNSSNTFGLDDGHVLSDLVLAVFLVIKCTAVFVGVAMQRTELPTATTIET